VKRSRLAPPSRHGLDDQAHDLGAVAPLGYRPAGHPDRYLDARGHWRHTTDDGYFFKNARGRLCAFTFHQLYRRSTLLSLYGDRETIVATFPRAARLRPFAAFEVGRWLVGAAVEQALSYGMRHRSDWDPAQHGFELNNRGRWVPCRWCAKHRHGHD
jgi:hypothetical protein